MMKKTAMRALLVGAFAFGATAAYAAAPPAQDAKTPKGWSY
jgi:hypothetical protein